MTATVAGADSWVCTCGADYMTVPLGHRCDRPVVLEDDSWRPMINAIVVAAASEWGVSSLDVIGSHSGDERETAARRAAVFVARTASAATLAEIGMVLGHRAVSTVAHLHEDASAAYTRSPGFATRVDRLLGRFAPGHTTIQGIAAA